MKIILITRDRPELTRQTIETMKANAANWSKHELCVVYDGNTKDERYQHLIQGLGDVVVHSTGSQLGVGGAKNFGIEILEYENASLENEIIIFSDNDMYWLQNWDYRLEDALKVWSTCYITQLGGWKHPYHEHGHLLKQFGPEKVKVWEVDAVTGNCFVIRYSDWKKYGPFDANALGPGQSEDYALSQKIKAGGGIVATLDPPVTIHCGLVNCLGDPATGWADMAVMAEKQIEENNIDKIWLSVPEEGTILLERINAGVTQLVESQPSKLSVEGSNPSIRSFKALNIGSGQRRFDNNKGWINCDIVSRPPDQVPDVIIDARKLTEKFEENSIDMVVLHHCIEHFTCGEADEVIKQCYKVLRPGGSLLIFVPDLRKLAGRWLSGELNTYLFLVNTYGAFQGLDGDLHKWGYDSQSLYDYLKSILFQDNSRNPAYWDKWIKPFDWREIPGADIARDWWVLGLEVIK